MKINHGSLFIALFLTLLFCGQSFAGSMLGLEALGKEDFGQATAATAGRGFAGGAKTGDGLSLINPSALSFEENVSFSATLDYEMTEASSKENSYASSSMNIPSLYLSFPLGSLGAFALGISERYAFNLSIESKNSETSQNVDLQYSGSTFEFVPVYALRLPFFRRLSLGASMHIVAGSIERSVKLGPDNSAISKEDAWASTNATVKEVAEGDFETESIGYYTLSAMYRGRHSSIYFSATTPYTLKNTLSYDFQFSQTDTLAPLKTERKIKVPLTLSAGVDFGISGKHHVLLDASARHWDKDIENIGGSWNLPEKTETQSELFLSLGYQRDGSKLFYDKYWQRMQFRVGTWYRDWYIKEVNEFGCAAGVGLPLGSRGTIVDITLLGGVRNASLPNWDEKFFGVRATLMGVGSWGKTRPVSH